MPKQEAKHAEHAPKYVTTAAQRHDALVYGKGVTEGRRQANAELLEALERIVGLLRNTDPDIIRGDGEFIISRAEAAIAKAKGKE